MQETTTIATATTHLSKQQVENLRDIFTLLDEGKTGFISIRDLPVALNLADLETTPEQRTGLIAVHVTDRDKGVTELELLTVADIVASTLKQGELSHDNSSAFSWQQEQLRMSFDALANNEHGVVPIEGVLQWGEDVMKACDECLLLEHGFDYKNFPERMASRIISAGGGSTRKKKRSNNNSNKNNKKSSSSKMKMMNLDGIRSVDANFDEDEDDDDDEEDDHDYVDPFAPKKQNQNNNDDDGIDFSSSSNNANRNLEFDDVQPPKKLQRRKSQTEEFITHELEKKKQKEEIERRELLEEQERANNNNGGKPRLIRRRSSSAILVPNQRFNYNDDENENDDENDGDMMMMNIPNHDNNTNNNDTDVGSRNNKKKKFETTTGSPHDPKSYRLPEVAAEQKMTGNIYSSFSNHTVGGKKLISHHNDATSIYGNDDVEQTTDWLLGLLGGRYKNASEGEKREIEMLMELARAAGHQVDSIAGILTKDAFVKFISEMRATSSSSESGTAATTNTANNVGGADQEHQQDNNTGATPTASRQNTGR